MPNWNIHGQEHLTRALDQGLRQNQLALRQPARREVQQDGRVRYWVFVPEMGKYLRVVTLEDGETLHNAFPDRDFREV